jgi:HEAT repeat protein
MVRRYALLAALPLLVAAQAAPPAPWAETRGDLDGDGKPERARLGRDGVLVVEAADGRELLQVPLPDAGRIERAQLRVVPVEERVALHVRAELGRGQAAEAVVSGGRVLFAGRTGPVGDGERAQRLRVDEAGIVRYQTSPGVARCDGEEQLFPERWDFGSGRFRAVTVDPPLGRRLKTAATAPAGLEGPPLGLFRFVAASTDSSGDRRADRLAAPRELEDGAPATVWQAGAGATAKGAWATARAQAGPQRVRAVRLTAGNEAPRAVTLVVGSHVDEQFTVEVGPGARWVTLPPDGAATACVSVVVAEPGPRGNALAEVAIYGDVDGPGGIAKLIDDVAEARADADGAARLLTMRGAAAAEAVAAALPTTTGLGRRRLIQVLAETATPATAPALGKALETAAGPDRTLVVDALARLGEAGVAQAARIYGDATQAAEARADAATVLGRVPGPTAVAALLAHAGQGEPLVRAAAMRAMARQFAAGSTEPFWKVLDEARGEAATGDVARAVAPVAREANADVRRGTAAVLRTAAAKTRGAQQFAGQLRVLRAIGDLGAEELLPTVREAARDREPVLRAAAATAAAHIAGGDAIARAAVTDADAGVRKAALLALGARAAAGAPQASPAEATHAPLAAQALADDAWPMVRHAAADALGSACAEARGAVAAPLTRALLGDGKELKGADASEEVRRAALAALGRCSPPLPTLTAVLTEPRQPTSVRELAAALVAKRGGPEAARALATALRDALGDPAADDRTAGLAVACTRALARVGDRSRPVLEALGEAANEPGSPAVRAAAMESIGLLCPDGAAEALRKGASDADGQVVRAARAAMNRCLR